MPVFPCFVLLWSSLISALGAETPRVFLREAVLVTKAGRVDYKAAGKDWVTAVQGQAVRFNEEIRTFADSRATLRAADLTDLQIGENSRVEILPPPPKTKARLNFKAGFFRLFTRNKSGEVLFQTPQIAAGNRGTEIILEVDPDAGRTVLTVDEGEVDIFSFGQDQTNLIVDSDKKWIFELGRQPLVVERAAVAQWWLFYPAVLDPEELALSAAEHAELADSLEAYRKGNLLRALEAYPVSRAPQSEADRVYYASVLLAVGQVAKTQELLQQVSIDNPMASALRRMIAAVNLRALDEPATPVLASEWLAYSYYDQSLAVSPEALSRALAAAKQAVTTSPDFGFALERLAELEFSYGHTANAVEYLHKSLKVSPENPQAHALNGFLLVAQNRVSAALKSFEEAIRLDGSLGNAWLGHGLCRIRQGQIEEGRADLQTAAALEPNRSLLRSYLGKAFSNADDNERARRELELAIKLDPNDPSPWLYSALLNQQNNRINEGIRDLERSQELNDNRYIYRSRLLLDQDRAVRSANLAQLFQDNGMTQVAVREATRAVDSEYNNASAHLFLANSYDALRDPSRIELRYETPWFHELLLANLLAPVGAGRLSQFVSQHEYSKLLEADGLGTSLMNEWRGDSEQRATASVFGTYKRTSFGFDVIYRNDNGDRPNSDDTRAEIYGQFKHQITANDTFYFLSKWQDQRSGDTFKTYDNRPLAPHVRFEERQAPGLLLAGWNHQWGPDGNTLFLGGRLSAEQKLSNPRATQLLLERDTTGLFPGFVQTVGMIDQFTDPALQNANPPAVSVGTDGQSLIYTPALLRGIAPFLGSGAVIAASAATNDFYTRREFEIYSAELQHIQRLDRNTFVAGGRLQAGQFETDTRLSVLRPNFDGGFATPAAQQHSTVDFTRANLYLYDFWNVAPWLTLIGGASWDHIEHPDNFRNPPVNDEQQRDEQFSGKLGFTLSPSPWFRVRGVYTEAVGGVSFDESVTLEPVQLAGFNQAYRTVLSESIAGSVETPAFKIWGLSMEGRLPSRTWWGASLNVIEQDVDRTVGAFTGYDLGVFPISPAYFPDSTMQRFDYCEQSFEVTINQLVGAQFAVGAFYRMTVSELHSTFPEIPTTILPTANTKDEATLQEVSLFCNWNSPIGIFGRLEANCYSQHLDDDPIKASRDGDEFCQFNALLGYRFNQNRGEISLGVLNINNAGYRLSPLNPYGDIARERTAVVRYRLTF